MWPVAPTSLGAPPSSRTRTTVQRAERGVAPRIDTAQAQVNGIGRAGTGAGTSLHPSMMRNAEAVSRALLALLHARLRITASQESAWSTASTMVVAIAVHERRLRLPDDDEPAVGRAQHLDRRAV